MSPKQRFVVMLEPGQLAVLKAIEEQTGARISEQVRRSVDAYIEQQAFLPKSRVKALLHEG